MGDKRRGTMAIEAGDIGTWVGAAGGILAFVWAAIQVFRTVTQDSREATKGRLDSHGDDLRALRVRVDALEKDESIEKGQGLPGRVQSLEDDHRAIEDLLRTQSAEVRRLEADVSRQSAAITAATSEVRSSTEKQEQILRGIDSLREDYRHATPK